MLEILPATWRSLRAQLRARPRVLTFPLNTAKASRCGERVRDDGSDGRTEDDDDDKQRLTAAPPPFPLSTPFLSPSSRHGARRRELAALDRALTKNAALSAHRIAVVHSRVAGFCDVKAIATACDCARHDDDDDDQHHHQIVARGALFKGDDGATSDAGAACAANGDDDADDGAPPALRRPPDLTDDEKRLLKRARPKVGAFRRRLVEEIRRLLEHDEVTGGGAPSSGLARAPAAHCRARRVVCALSPHEPARAALASVLRRCSPRRSLCSDPSHALHRPSSRALASSRPRSRTSSPTITRPARRGGGCRRWAVAG